MSARLATVFAALGFVFGLCLTFSGCTGGTSGPGMGGSSGRSSETAEERVAALEKRLAEMEQKLKEKGKAPNTVSVNGQVTVAANGEREVNYGVKFAVPPNLTIEYVTTFGSSNSIGSYTISEQKGDHFKVKNNLGNALSFKWRAEGQVATEGSDKEK
jgi:hypothetical protein